MSAAVRSPTVDRMSGAEEDAGARIQVRRTRIGMSKQALAERSGVDRGTLAAIEAGGAARDTTIAAIDRALDELEAEMGFDQPVESTEAGLIEFGVDVDAIGVHVVVKGPIANAAELEASVARLIRDIRRSAGDNPDLPDS